MLYSLATLHALLSPLLLIPASSLILMHTRGWQIDDTSLPAFLEECKQQRSASSSAVGTSIHQDGSASSSVLKARRADIYCFNRDHLDADPDELEQDLMLSSTSFLRDPPLAGALTYSAA